jgi:hypothetical protein
MRTSIDEFWERTHEAWLTGHVAEIIPDCRKAVVDVDSTALGAQFTPKEFACLNFILSDFGPLAGEFFCGGDNECALTNYRVGQRDGVTKQHYVMPLGILTGQIDEKGWWTKMVTYHFTNGRTLTLSKLGSFIPSKNVMAAQRWGDYADIGEQLELLIGNVNPSML